ncbi:MAG: RNA polymerase sigma factor [Myxococcota bacterium]
MQKSAEKSALGQSGIFPVARFGEEQELIDALLVDDEGAWREFNRRYSRLVLSCITRVTARFGYAGTDDVQEIYATLCLQLLSNDKKKLRSFESGRGTRLGTWLGLLATHTAYDFLRSVRRAPKHDDLTTAASVSTSAPDPAETTLLREQAQLLARALAELSEKDRMFVELFYAHGLPAEEVAARMGINIKTVYTKKHKLQARLQGLLAAGRLAA